MSQLHVQVQLHLVAEVTRAAESALPLVVAHGGTVLYRVERFAAARTEFAHVVTRRRFDVAVLDDRGEVLLVLEVFVQARVSNEKRVDMSGASILWVEVDGRREGILDWRIEQPLEAMCPPVEFLPRLGPVWTLEFFKVVDHYAERHQRDLVTVEAGVVDDRVVLRRMSANGRVVAIVADSAREGWAAEQFCQLVRAEGNGIVDSPMEWASLVDIQPSQRGMAARAFAGQFPKRYVERDGHWEKVDSQVWDAPTVRDAFQELQGMIALAPGVQVEAPAISEGARTWSRDGQKAASGAKLALELGRWFDGRSTVFGDETTTPEEFARNFSGQVAGPIYEQTVGMARGWQQRARELDEQTEE